MAAWPARQEHRQVAFDSAAARGGKLAAMLYKWPVPRGKDWLDWANRPPSEAELAALRKVSNAIDLTETRPGGTPRRSDWG